MDYTSIKQTGQDLILMDIKHFIPEQVLDCGQCFRWQAADDNMFRGIAHGRSLTLFICEGERGWDLIIKNAGSLEFENSDSKTLESKTPDSKTPDSKNLWKDYFDLDRDYGQLRQHYATDPTLAKAITYSPGLRIMRQDPWETLITFILSQNSNIPRIKGMVEKLCRTFGRVLPGPDKGHAFPEPNDLASLSVHDLAPIKSGYRAGYIIDAAKKISEGILNIKELEKMPTEDIRRELMGICGVGPKVADCVLLYGFGRVECFPLDVWMKRVMAKYYPKGFPQEFCDTAGIAQQFLFHYERTL